MLYLQDRFRWLRWFILDHLLMIIIIIMMATVVAVLFIRPGNEISPRNTHLENSLN